MKFTVLSLFPEVFDVLKDYSVIGRGLEEGAFEVQAVNIRDYAQNKHGKVDDYSYGGGPGMLMAPGPLVRAIEDVSTPSSHVILLSPKGQVLSQKRLARLKDKEDLVLVNGHYEGVDQRVIDHYIDEEVSIGDYVLSGGELASLVLIDGLARLLPGVLSNEDSALEESHSSQLLEYPQYTRPQDFRGHKVPDILLSGDHAKIEDYRHKQALEETLVKRPDLLEGADLDQEDQQYLDKLKEKYRR